MASQLPDFQTIVDDFAFLDDWDERYRYLIDLGRSLAPFPDELRSEQTRVRGCASQVWLSLTTHNGQFSIKGDSDASIVKGLVALVIALYDGRTLDAAAALDATAELKKLDLDDHITPQRANGLVSMLTVINKTANAQT